MGTLTSGLARVGAVRLPSLVPRDPPMQCMETTGYMAQCHSQWHSKPFFFYIVFQSNILQLIFYYDPFVFC